MENQNPTNKIVANNSDENETVSKIIEKNAPIPKKVVKPPKIEDKPFEEFVNKHFIPDLKSSIDKNLSSI